MKNNSWYFWGLSCVVLLLLSLALNALAEAFTLNQRENHEGTPHVET